MKTNRILTMALALMLVLPAAAQDVRFSKYFTDGTLRFDCLREGDARHDTVWVERWLDRSAGWHGSRTRLVDPIDNGDYRVEMRDAKSGRVLYSRCYSNLFREYKDTPEGRREVRRFEETHLLPMPKRAVSIAFQRRNEQLAFVDQTVVPFDPRQQELDFNYRIGERTDLEVHGAPSEKVDVVIVAQGYTAADDPRLRIDYYRMKEILFSQEPFRSHREDFNVYGVCADVEARFHTFGIDRYLMTFSLFRLHDMLGTTPADHIVIMVNDSTYGGGAIYNFYAVSSLHVMAEKVLPHEFGHSFGGLADEYVDEDLSYGSLHRTKYEPLEPNITNRVDFSRKWGDLIASGTPVPTPPNPAVPRDQCGPVGLYEGAGYSATGVFRPAMRCMMRDYAPFCPVCARRIEEVFSLYTK
ncbi:MAG: hypothetical protein J6I49_09115 [Bacteroidales bacterium]|nr:hypothetical protein [Bacteroidales bacterium]